MIRDDDQMTELRLFPLPPSPDACPSLRFLCLPRPNPRFSSPTFHLRNTSGAGNKRTFCQVADSSVARTSNCSSAYVSPPTSYHSGETNKIPCSSPDPYSKARGRTIIAHVSPREHKLTFASLAESFPTGVIIISSPKLFTKTHSPSLRQLPALHLCSLHGQPSPIVQLESSPTFRKNHCPHKGRIVAHISSPQTFQGNTQDLHFMHLPLLHRSLPRKESSPTFHLPKLPTKT